MFSRLTFKGPLRSTLKRSFYSSSQLRNDPTQHHPDPLHHSHLKVAVLGASGGIGQPLSLLLKQSPKVGQLSLYDVANTQGMAADLSHIETRAKVTGYQGLSELPKCLKGSDVVLIPAGVPRKPGMTRDDLFNTNASIVKDLVSACADFCPDSMICIITNPVNSTVPIAAEVLKEKNVFNARKLFGVTTLDVVRTNTFVADQTGFDASKITIPVVGGHSGVTIVPLLSQAIPPIDLNYEEQKKMTIRIQNAGTEVVEAKAGAGSATLSMAYAAAKFTFALLDALEGEEGIVECAYVRSDETAAAYIATPLLLGPEGAAKNLGLFRVNDYETELIQAALPELISNIQKGVDFVQKS